MHCSKKLLGNGHQGYFNEKVRSTCESMAVDGSMACESMAQHTSPSLFPARGMLTNTSHHRGSVRTASRLVVVRAGIGVTSDSPLYILGPEGCRRGDS